LGAIWAASAESAGDPIALTIDSSACVVSILGTEAVLVTDLADSEIEPDCQVLAIGNSPLDQTPFSEDTMAKFNSNSPQQLSRRIGAGLAIASCLLISTITATSVMAAPAPQLAQRPSELPAMPSIQRSQVPRSILQAVRRDLARHLNIARRDVQIVSTDRATWPNGCLGLARPGEFCTEALVEGWRVTAMANNQTWVYRTAARGAQVRRETNSAPGNSSQLPRGVRDRVLETAAREFNLSTRQLRVAEAEPRTWNGCLGIEEPGMLCTQIAIFGWRVVLTDGSQRWVYHTNQDGSEVRFNARDSQISRSDTIASIAIPAVEMPQPLERGVVFRSILSGGFTGERRQITLYQDGHVVSQGDRGPSASFRVSRQQVEQFRRLLNEQQFDRFHALNFSAAAGSADYITVMLISPNSVTQYADSIQDRLPSELQRVIQTWSTEIVQARPNARF